MPLFSVALSEVVAASTAGLFAASPAGSGLEDSVAFSWLLDELSLRLGELTGLEFELESDWLLPKSLLLEATAAVSLELPPEELQLPVLFAAAGLVVLCESELLPSSEWELHFAA